MKKVAAPPRTSRRTVDPRSVMWKYRSRPPLPRPTALLLVVPLLVMARRLPEPRCVEVTAWPSGPCRVPRSVLDMPRRVRRPDPPPLESNDAAVVLVGTSLWAGALLVLAVLELGDLARVRGWWMGMCAYGVALGVFGLWYVRRRRAAISRDAARGVPRRS